MSFFHVMTIEIPGYPIEMHVLLPLQLLLKFLYQQLLSLAQPLNFVVVVRRLYFH